MVLTLPCRRAIGPSLTMGVMVSGLLLGSCGAGELSAPSPSTTNGSSVRLTDGVPRLYVQGKPLPTVATEVFDIPDRQGVNLIPAYGTDLWLARMTALVDDAKARHVPLIMVHPWWSEMNTVESRPTRIGEALDFSPLDKLMAHAQTRGVYVMLIVNLQTFAPDWWKKENHVPPFKGEADTCDICETDSYGNVYSNASYDSDIVKTDFGDFVAAVVERYKDHPALAGWTTGIGPTGEDFFGPSYVVVAHPAAGDGSTQRSLMYTDYSPFFQRQFRRWLAEKYVTDGALQRVWGAAAALATAAIPSADQLVKCTEGESALSCPLLFPDPSLGPLDDGTKVLTAQGADFYAFRNMMRKAERDYFIGLVKRIDQNHVLLVQGGGFANDEVLQDSRVDGFVFEPSVSFDWPVTRTSLVEDIGPNMGFVEQTARQKKILIVTATNIPSAQLHESTGRWESANQIRYLEGYGQALRCVGGVVANSVDLKERSAPGHNFPVWFSDETMAAFDRIVSYAPAAATCACDVVSKLYLDLGCTGQSAPAGCGHVAPAYQRYCDGR